MAFDSETYRRDMIRRLQKENERRSQRALEKDAEKAQIAEDGAKFAAQKARLSLPLPSPDLCPDCYFLHGRQSVLRAKTHDEPENFDLIACDVCGHQEDRPNG